jgi:hypothetical protein
MTTPEDLARAYFGAVGSGDRDRLRAVLSPDVVYRFPGRNPFSQTYQGRDAVIAYIDRLRDLTGGTMHVTVRDVLIGSETCAGWVRAEAERDGRAFGWNLVAILTCSDTAINGIALYYDDQHGVDDFLAAAG